MMLCSMIVYIVFLLSCTLFYHSQMCKKSVSPKIKVFYTFFLLLSFPNENTGVVSFRLSERANENQTKDK